MNNSRHFWTEERMVTLARLWRADYTGLKIAQALGCTVGAVLGKLNAMGLIGADPKRSARQARKKWTDPAYRARTLASLHGPAGRARARHVRACGLLSRRIAARKRIIDPDALVP